MDSAGSEQLSSKWKILVTGASGLIGHHMVLRLLRQGHSVVGVGSLRSADPHRIRDARLKQQGIALTSLTSGVEGSVPRIQSKLFLGQSGSGLYQFVKGDVSEKWIIDFIKDGRFDCIIHLAAQSGIRESVEDPRLYLKDNIETFLNILEGCRAAVTVKHLLYASSGSIYDDSNEPPFSEECSTDRPKNLYAVSKKTNEVMAYSYSQMYQIPTTGIRLFKTYGPGSKTEMLFANKIYQGETISLYNHGKIVRDFTYIDDAIQLIFKILHKPPTSDATPVPHQIFNLGTSRAEELIDLISYIEEGLGKQANKQLLPPNPGELLNVVSDCTKIYEFAQYTPKTSLREGVHKFCQWFLQWKEGKEIKA